MVELVVPFLSVQEALGFLWHSSGPSWLSRPLLSPAQRVSCGCLSPEPWPVLLQAHDERIPVWAILPNDWGAGRAELKDHHHRVPHGLQVSKPCPLPSPGLAVGSASNCHHLDAISSHHTDLIWEPSDMGHGSKTSDCCPFYISN